jgi:hypothetical protein
MWYQPLWLWQDEDHKLHLRAGRDQENNSVFENVFGIATTAVATGTHGRLFREYAKLGANLVKQRKSTSLFLRAA